MQYIREIGKGGLGVVSLYQGNNGLLYAVKRMKNKWNRIQLQRFWREIDIMSSLNHPNIVSVLSYNKDMSDPYYVMHYFKEGSLKDRMNELRNKNHRFSEAAATSMALVIAQALNYAHAQGAIHRDLTPGNILFKNKIPIVSDWGIGKFIHFNSQLLTSENGVGGTRGYSAPEQLETGKSDNRADIYSLGIIYREMVVGAIAGQVENPDIARIINKMTAFSPNNRYNNMDEVVNELLNLNLVKNTKNPIEDFWDEYGNTVMITAGTLALIWLLSKVLK